MQRIFVRLGKQVLVLVVFFGADLAISIPIMGATYRPFSWMSIASADAATLYPVIQNLSFQDGNPCLTVDLGPGETGPTAANARCVLQRSTNLLDATAWTDVTATSGTDRVIFLIDTNPVSRSVYYRVKQILNESP
jgi:hypothetical protein